MQCETCPMGNVRTCGSRGPSDSKIVLVGEAPGRDELREGKPFVGKSGKLLDKALRACGVEDGSQSMFVTNATFCIPSKDKKIQTEACKSCHSRLDETLKEHPHDVVILLGNWAVRSVTDNYAAHITVQRGKAIDTPYGIAIPTFHPAFCLRQPGQYKTFLEDMKYAISIANGGEVKSPGTASFTIADDTNADELVNHLMQYPYIAADIETSERDPRRDQILCIGLCGKKNEVSIFPARLLSKLRPLFESESEFIWHNGKFDTAFLENYGFNVRIDHDTMLQSYALSETGDHKLKSLAAVELGAKNWAADLKKWLDDESPSWADIPENILYEYLAQDADNTFQLFNVFSERLDNPRESGPKWAYEHVMIPAANFLRGVERHGAYIDVGRVELLREELLQTTADYRDEMRAYLQDQAFNPNSPQQVLKALRRCGIKVNKTDKDTIKPFERRSELVRTLLVYRSDKKQLGTYVEGVLKRMDAQNRVHSTFTIHVAVNGRLSSKNPNMQNIPAGVKGKRIKRIFGAPEGRCIIELDYSQAELRWLAVLSGDKWLKQVYLDGRDLHNEMSLALIGPDYTEEQRRLIKTINFGIPYGRQAPAITEAVNREIANTESKKFITVQDAQNMVDGWFERMPEATVYLAKCRTAVIRRGYVMSAYGRKRRFPMVTLDTVEELQNQASNHGISSSASDTTLTSAMVMEPWLEERNAFIFNLVHDSIMIECPSESAMQIAYHCKAVMEQMPITSFKTEVPFIADVKIGTHWGDAIKVDDEHLEELSWLPEQRFGDDYVDGWWKK